MKRLFKLVAREGGIDFILSKERKRWSKDQRRAVAAETIAADEATGIARRHGANPGMVFAWRKHFMDQQHLSEAASALKPVMAYAAIVV